jgi:hypothetical protein
MTEILMERAYRPLLLTECRTSRRVNALPLLHSSSFILPSPTSLFIFRVVLAGGYYSLPTLATPPITPKFKQVCIHLATEKG